MRRAIVAMAIALAACTPTAVKITPDQAGILGFSRSCGVTMRNQYKLILVLSGVSVFLSGFLFIRIMPNGTTSENVTSFIGFLITVSSFIIFVRNSPKSL